MSLLKRKEKIVTFSEGQRDDMIEKLEHSHVKYDIVEKSGGMFGDGRSYIFKVNAGDLKKVI